MNVHVCLSSFERMVVLLGESKDAALWLKFEALVLAYPWPELSRRDRWRLDQVKSNIQQQITVLNREPNESKD